MLSRWWWWWWAAAAALGSGAAAALGSGAAPSPQQIAQTNLLFIIFDDLRPELSVYGKRHMLTPNFERLAAKSVVFDSVYSQVAVCNPSRDSLLTGLRPDTLGNYAFQTSFKPHLTFLTQLARSGYRTSGFGKVMHWDGNDREVWTGEQYWGEWYENQNKEWDGMKSTVWPDRQKNASSFYDHDFATKAIANLRRQAAVSSEYFVTAIGFKLPHTLLHFPHSYLDLYRQHFSGPDFVNVSAQGAARCTFPPSTSLIAYRCCAGDQFKYMNAEGERRSDVQRDLKFQLDLDTPLPELMARELQWGYAAAISFVDSQLGRVLDAIDELKLWGNLTIVLTADHGMHNGEKGIWEKWTLFDEATRVPLMIHHPLSPFQGQHYTEPVELIDVFPTIIDLLNPPYDKEKIYNARRSRHPRKFLPFGGKSLAPMVLGMQAAPLMWTFKNGQSRADSYYLLPASVSGVGRKRAQRGRPVGAGADTIHGLVMPRHRLQFALSQIWRCSPKVLTALDARNASDRQAIKAWFKRVRREDRSVQWLDCNMRNTSLAIQHEEDSFMGYSMRSAAFRYTVWLPFDRVTMTPMWSHNSSSASALTPPPSIEFFHEELYDHRQDGFAASLLGRGELVNLALDPAFASVLAVQRQRLLVHLYTKVLYKIAAGSTAKAAPTRTAWGVNGLKWDALFAGAKV